MGQPRRELMDPVDVRVTGSSNDGFDLLLASSASSDADAYLAGAAYDEVDGIEFEGSDIDHVHHDRAAAPSAPSGETRWVTSVEAPGVQTLDCSVEQGKWSVCRDERRRFSRGRRQPRVRRSKMWSPCGASLRLA